jgi:hypothetical protein
MNENTVVKTYQELKDECAPVFYKEIERFFAKGMLVQIADELDIIEAALVIQNDNSKQLEQWITENKVIRVNDKQAIKWSKINEPLMALTAVPWVLVQEINQ